MEPHQYKFISLLIILLLYIIYRFFYQLKQEKDDKKSSFVQNYLKLKNAIKNSETRVNYAEFNETEFWEIIEKINKRSEESYSNSLGLFKDFIVKYTASELIELDNLIQRLIKDNINQDLRAASTIIFKSDDINLTFLLMSIFMSKGQVFFNQACLNPNLIIGKQISGINKGMLWTVISDLYFKKTNKLLPLIKGEYLIDNIPDEECDYKDLPVRYSELWNAFL